MTHHLECSHPITHIQVQLLIEERCLLHIYNYTHYMRQSANHFNPGSSYWNKLACFCLHQDLVIQTWVLQLHPLQLLGLLYTHSQLHHYHRDYIEMRISECTRSKCTDYATCEQTKV